MNWTEVVVTLISSVGAVAATTVPAWLVITRRMGRVHEEVRTGNGMTLGQEVNQIKDGQDALIHLLAEHTRSDAEQFASVRREIRDLHPEGG